MVIMGLIGAWGWWIVTKPRPGFKEQEEVERGRWGARWRLMLAEMGVALAWVPVPDAGRVWLVATAGGLVWMGARGIKEYWPRVIGEAFSGLKVSWNACYVGFCGGLLGVVLGVALTGMVPAPVQGWVVGGSGAVGGGCFLYALFVMGVGGKRAGDV